MRCSNPGSPEKNKGSKQKRFTHIITRF